MDMDMEICVVLGILLTFSRFETSESCSNCFEILIFNEAILNSMMKNN